MESAEYHAQREQREEREEQCVHIRGAMCAKQMQRVGAEWQRMQRGSPWPGLSPGLHMQRGSPWPGLSPGLGQIGGSTIHVSQHSFESSDSVYQLPGNGHEAKFLFCNIHDGDTSRNYLVRERSAYQVFGSEVMYPHRPITVRSFHLANSHNIP